MTARLHIDWTRCDGRGLCAELLPELLERDEWGYPVVRGTPDGQRGEAAIGGADSDAARDAVKLCPVLALSLLPPRTGST